MYMENARETEKKAEGDRGGMLVILVTYHHDSYLLLDLSYTHLFPQHAEGWSTS